MNDFGSGFDAAVQAARLAWERMLDILFRPFDMGKWFMLGFAAWLATLGEGGGGGFPGVNMPSGSGLGEDGGNAKPEFRELLQQARDWCHANPVAVNWIIVGVVVLAVFCIALGIVVCWLNSRGKFMLLDNVVRNGQRISEPWCEFRKEGNSLFWWRFWYGLGVQLPLVVLWLGGVVWCVAAAAGYSLDGLAQIGLKKWLLVAFVAFALMVPALLAATVPAFLKAFGVPLMYKYRIGAGAALAYAWGLFKARWKWFVAYFVLGIAVALAVGVAVIVVGLGTCCIAFFLMAIPYLGAVVLLPVTVFYMAWRVHFLELVHPELQIFPPPASRGNAVM